MLRTHALSLAAAALIAVPLPAPAQTAAHVAPPPPTSGVTGEFTMFVGEVKTLPITDVRRVAVGNGKLVTANVLDDGVLLLGEKAGDTSLFVWVKGSETIKRYKLHVTGTDTNETLNSVRAVLAVFPGLKAQMMGGAVVVSGETNKENIARLQIALQPFPNVLNLTRQEDVTLKKMIYMKVQIMEFKKSALQNLGVSWDTSVVGPAGALTFDLFHNQQFRYAPQTLDPTFTVGSGAAQPLSIPSQAGRAYLGIASVITSRLNLAVQNGDAWILASPELSTRSGGEAKFLAGGQVPLPTVSATGQSSVTFKDYGIKLTLKPVVDDSGNIAATIQTELSAIDPSVTVQGIPGFTTRQTDSEINVKNGQTIVISGLVNQTLNNTIDKFPFLGDLPVLGQLFKSTNFQTGRTDLVIFVTPTVTDPTSTINEQRLEKSKDLRDRFEKFLGKKGIVD